MDYMTEKEFQRVVRLIKECHDWLDNSGKQPDGRTEIEKIAKWGARKEVLERLDSLYERLDRAGLRLVREEV